MKKILTEAISTKLEQIKGNYTAADGEMLAVAVTDGECCMLIIKKKAHLRLKYIRADGKFLTKTPC